MLSVTVAGTRQAREEASSDEPLTLLAALDADAWQSLFERYYGHMYAFAFARTGDASAAEEIAAEVFLAATKGIQGYKARGAPFAAWLYRIARNLTADHLNRRKRQAAIPLEAVEHIVTAWDPAVEDTRDIATAMQKLTREQQEVLLLRFFSDCSLEETAGAMEKSIGAIKVLQHRALAAMRRHLTGGRE